MYTSTGCQYRCKFTLRRCWYKSRAYWYTLPRYCYAHGRCTYGSYLRCEQVHIFSLASGHLYERFLLIMMQSVVEKTTR